MDIVVDLSRIQLLYKSSIKPQGIMRGDLNRGEGVLCQIFFKEN